MEMPKPQGAPAAAPQGNMQPAPAPAGQAAAQMSQVVTEGLNIAVQAGLEAAQAASQDPGIAEETRMKIEQGVLTLSEALEEIQGAAAMPASQPTTTGQPMQNERAVG